MSRTKNYIHSLLGEMQEVRVNLGSAMWDERLDRYLWLRIKPMLLRLAVRVPIHFFQFIFLYFYFPIFEWADLFVFLRITIIYEAFSWGVFENLRRELREISHFQWQKKVKVLRSWKMTTVVLSTLPILYLAWELYRHLYLRQNYFNFYDASIIVFFVRSAVSVFFQWLSSSVGHDRRIHLPVFAWLVPLLLTAITAVFGFMWIGPWAIPLSFAVEALLGQIATVYRLRRALGKAQYQLSDLFKTVKFKSFVKPNLKGSMYFASLSVAFKSENFLFIYLFQQYGEMALIIHGVSPLMKMFSQLPFLFWLEFAKQKMKFYSWFISRLDRIWILFSVVMVLLFAGVKYFSLIPEKNPQVFLLMGIAVASVLLGGVNYVILKHFYYPAKEYESFVSPKDLLKASPCFYHVIIKRSFWRSLRKNQMLDRLISAYPGLLQVNRQLYIPKGEVSESKVTYDACSLLGGYVQKISLLTAEKIENEFLLTTKDAPVFDFKKMKWVPHAPLKDLTPQQKEAILFRIGNSLMPVGKLHMEQLKVRFTKLDQSRVAIKVQ